MLGLTFEFAKANSQGSYIRGWASVVSVAGVDVEDTQGDVIKIDDIRKAAHDFITNARVAKAMHKGDAVGEVVESLVIDDDVAKALGMSGAKRGWFIGMKIHDEGIQKRVRDGDLRAFSIGGKGTRIPIEAVA